MTSRRKRFCNHTCSSSVPGWMRLTTGWGRLMTSRRSLMTSWRRAFCDKISPGNVPGLKEIDDGLGETDDEQEEPDDELEEGILRQGKSRQRSRAGGN